MPFFSSELLLRKPTETEQIRQEDYNDNLDIIDQAFVDHFADNQAHGLDSLAARIDSHSSSLFAHGEDLSTYKLNKDGFGVFTEIQWKRPDETLAKKTVLSNGTPPYYTLKTVSCYEEDGTTIKEIKEYELTYDQDNDLVSEVRK